MLDKNINNSLQTSQALIADFVASSDFNNSLLTAYGDSFDLSLATDLLQSIATGETALPITMVDSSVINGARGAYAGDTDTIYLSSELVSSGDTAVITRTLLEEIGHFVDAKINSSDAAGDEGAIFASLVLDEELSTRQLELLQTEDDTAIVEIEGENIAIEQMATIFVDADATGASDGSSWTDAFADLQSALEIATSEDQIWVADGIYVPTNGEDREISFFIPSGVEIYGGFAGGESELSQRDYINNQTILSGEIGEDTNVDNSLNVINITDTTASTLVDGFIISDGHADSRTSTSLDGDKGGGILGAENASAIIRNSIVRNNFASSSGGGLRTGSNSNVSIINTVFHDNLSDGSGGAVSFARNTNTPNVLNSLFYNNEAQFGGAIYNSSNELTITNSTFVDNLASEGDSLYISRQDADDIEIIANSIFWNTNGRDNSQIVRRLPTVFDASIVNNSILTTEYEEEDVSENNSTEDPQFIDPENNDFRLQANSPGIDVGNNEAISAETDIIGNPRIFNDTVDIGAYEYGFFVAIEDAAVEESTEQVNAEFNVTLLDSAGNPTNQEVSLNYTTIEDTATADEDFTPTFGTLTFSAEETTQTIVVPIASDSTNEDAETFFVELSDLSGNAVISDARAVGTINDSQIAEISIADATVEEGDSGETAIEFTISLNEEYTEDISVDYSIVEDAATAESDYVDINGTVTFEAGETEQNITILVQGDDEIEEDETFFVQLSNPSENASLANEQATGTIINDDSEEVATRTISIDDVAVEEGKEGETTIDFTVSLDEAATETITVNYATVADTATAEEDFIATEGILTFAPEEQEKTISVLVRGDTNIEEDETFFFELSNPTGNATLENETAVATIQDDDRDDDRVAPLNTTINRFRNKDVPGTYLFAGETESENIRENFANFEDEGVAFQVADESGDDLIPLYRFQSTRTPGTYLFAGEAERENINENFADDFNEEGLAFYVYGVGADLATEFVRFQNSVRPGTYLFAGPEEAEGIRDNFPSFEEEGVAFEVVI